MTIKNLCMSRKFINRVLSILNTIQFLIITVIVTDATYFSVERIKINTLGLIGWLLSGIMLLFTIALVKRSNEPNERSC
jgi:hypothetical protein